MLKRSKAVCASAAEDQKPSTSVQGNFYVRARELGLTQGMPLSPPLCVVSSLASPAVTTPDRNSNQEEFAEHSCLSIPLSQISVLPKCTHRRAQTQIQTKIQTHIQKEIQTQIQMQAKQIHFPCVCQVSAITHRLTRLNDNLSIDFWGQAFTNSMKIVALSCVTTYIFTHF